MPENSRIEELRRRVQKDKASIAFAQLAEEYRRGDRFQEAIETCRTGLSHHPGYLSAHVTLGRALIETGELQMAQDELRHVLAAAPENLAAIKGLAEIHHRRGELREAVDLYSRALEFVPHDPDLESLVAQIGRELQPDRGTPEVADGLSFEEAVGEFLALSEREAPPAAESGDPVPPAVVSADPVPPAPPPSVSVTAGTTDDESATRATGPDDLLIDLSPAALPADVGAADPAVPAAAVADSPVAADSTAPADSAAAAAGHPDAADLAPADPSPAPRVSMQVEALERWLDEILADRGRRE